MRPKGSGGAGASAALALLDDIPVSPASRRLASAPAALGTRPIVLSPRAARGGKFGSHDTPGDSFPMEALAGAGNVSFTGKSGISKVSLC
jgi:hypothetical protein